MKAKTTLAKLKSPIFQEELLSSIVSLFSFSLSLSLSPLSHSKKSGTSSSIPFSTHLQCSSNNARLLTFCNLPNTFKFPHSPTPRPTSFQVIFKNDHIRQTLRFFKRSCFQRLGFKENKTPSS